MNAAMIKRIGRDATGEICHKVMHGLDETCPGCTHEKVMLGESIKTEVVSPKDNRYFYVSNSPISHIPGSISKLTIFRDITENKKIEERLQQAQKMESIGNLAGGIAHDFNNLLFPIVGMAEMLLEDLPQDSIEYENAQEIFIAGKRAGELVKQILAFSRQSEHKMTPVRIQNVLKEVLNLSRSTIPANIKLYDKIRQNCGLVLADPTQVHQIAMNLITNAFHAVEEKNGIINIEIEEVTVDTYKQPDNILQPGQYVRLSVSDNGIGMEQKIIDKIFEPYFTTKEKGKGTGLGLAVVYGIVKEHKGDIKIYSEVGKGTTFNVYFPLMKKIEQETPSNKTEIVQTGTERILLVDDEVSVARLEQQMLERLGYHVISRTGSVDALETFHTSPNLFDIVLPLWFFRV
jgi:nitrogen-specific signal transduction histidine kinase